MEFDWDVGGIGGGARLADAYSQQQLCDRVKFNHPNLPELQNGKSRLSIWRTDPRHVTHLIVDTRTWEMWRDLTEGRAALSVWQSFAEDLSQLEALTPDAMKKLLAKQIVEGRGLRVENWQFRCLARIFGTVWFVDNLLEDSSDSVLPLKESFMTVLALNLDCFVTSVSLNPPEAGPSEISRSPTHRRAETRIAAGLALAALLGGLAYWKRGLISKLVGARS